MTFGIQLYDNAWAEAEAVCPPGRMMVDTLEFRHSALNPPLRIVVDTEGADREFTLEDDAPVHAGQTRKFLACPVQMKLTAMSADEMPKIDFVIDNIGRELAPYVRAAVRQREPIILRYRGYILQDPDEVHFGPIELRVSEFLISGNSLSATATLMQLQKVEFPSKTYDRDQFPALIAQL